MNLVLPASCRLLLLALVTNAIDLESMARGDVVVLASHVLLNLLDFW